tara:strand:+ start:606 stop:758 length:153 start_codon:yes stop_codon:yes gene_type:complete
MPKKKVRAAQYPKGDPRRVPIRPSSKKMQLAPAPEPEAEIESEPESEPEE